MNDFITKQLLFDHFAGRLTALQRSRIEEWLQTPANYERYYEWLEEWERLNLQYVANAEKGLQQSLLTIEQWGQTRQEPATQPLVVRRNPFFGRWMAVAATIAVCLLTGLYASRSYWFYKTVETAYGEVRQLSLADGSMVTLNAHSTLKLARFGFGRDWFGLATRDVQLTGEALFSVTHTPTNQPFVVRTENGPEVVVLGTEFTVFARPRGTKVVLNRGRVNVRYHQPDHQIRQVAMKPGDLVTVSATGAMHYWPTKHAPDKPAWLDHRFVFDQTPLSELAAVFFDQFGIRLTISDPALANLTVSGSFTAHTADELLEILSVTASLSYRRTGDSVVLVSRNERH